MNSTILILNDRIGYIKRNPEDFVKDLVQALLSGQPAIWSNGQLITMHHADDTAIIAVGGNRADVLGHATGPVDDMEALKQVVSQLGYELRKKTDG